MTYLTEDADVFKLKHVSEIDDDHFNDIDISFDDTSFSCPNTTLLQFSSRFVTRTTIFIHSMLDLI